MKFDLSATGPLNSSPSKQKYTIPKALRQTGANISYCSEVSYNLPSTLNNRQASIGYGQKYDLSKQVTQVPGPGTYQYNDLFDEDIKKNKGKSFAVSRDRMEMQGILGNINPAPAPNKYLLPDQITSPHKFSFGLRPQLKDKNITPGPGQYESLEAINKKGIYQFSKFHNSGASIIGKDQDRFKTISMMDNPEPGRYSMDNVGINKYGVYPKNGYKSVVQQSFGKSERKGFFSKVEPTPGPGSYKVHSDFI